MQINPHTSCPFCKGTQEDGDTENGYCYACEKQYFYFCENEDGCYEEAIKKFTVYPSEDIFYLCDACYDMYCALYEYDNYTDEHAKHGVSQAIFLSD